MKILRVCNAIEREILRPHVEAWLAATRVFTAMSGDMDRDGVVFDPALYAWTTEDEPAPPETPEGD